MHGEKIPSGAALKGLATGRAIPTRQTTPVAGFQQKAEDTQTWMIMMGWKVSKLVTYGSWTTCWCPKSGLLGRVNKSVDCLLLASVCHVVLLVFTFGEFCKVFGLCIERPLPGHVLLLVLIHGNGNSTVIKTQLIFLAATTE